MDAVSGAEVGEVERGLDATTRHGLPVIFAGVGGFYLLAAVVVPFLPQESRPDAGLIARWAGTAALGLVGAVVLRRWKVPTGWANPIAGVLGAVTVVNSLFLVDQAGPAFVFALVVALLAFALFLLSVPWMVGLVVLAMGGWLYLAYQAGGGPEWTPRTFNLTAIAFAAVAAQVMRVAMHRRLEQLKARDLLRIAQEAELARQRALLEQRRRIVRMTAHELGTPMTPVLLQAHLLGKGELSPEQRENLVVLQRNLDRLQGTIKKVVDAARADEEGSFYETVDEHA
jgi:signal transduction histidine kinase